MFNPASSSASAPTRRGTPIFEHLIDPEFQDWDDVSTPDLVGAQAQTAQDWFARMGSPEHLLRDGERAAAQKAFTGITDIAQTDEERRKSIAALRTPTAVRHLAGMLSEYDWDFVEQAKELRGYVVAKLLEETKHPDARIRLRALELTGRLTEVASFTDRTEVTHVQQDASELAERIRAKLKNLLPPVMEIETLTPKEA